MVAEQAEPGHATISPQRRKVWRLVALGLTNKEIATALRIAQNTANAHLDGLFKALGINNRQHALILALAHGVVTMEDALALMPHIVAIDPESIPSPWLPLRRADLPKGILAPGALQLTYEQMVAIRRERLIPVGHLAGHMGVHRNTVSNVRSGSAFHEYGPRDIGPRKQGEPLLQGVALDRAIALRRKGWSYEAIAKDNGTLSWAAVRVELVRAIGDTPDALRGGPRPGSRASRVWPYVQQGLSNAEIAEKTGMSRSHVSTAVWQCQNWAQNRKPYWAKQVAL